MGSIDHQHNQYRQLALAYIRLNAVVHNSPVPQLPFDNLILPPFFEIYLYALALGSVSGKSG